MESRRRLAHGLSGALTFLVLVEGYVLVGGSVPSVAIIGGLAVVVGVLGAVLAGATERLLTSRNEQP